MRSVLLFAKMTYDTVLVAGGLITHHRLNEALKKKSEAWGF